MSTKWRDDEISCRISTIATKWSRSRCSSATRALSRATSSSLPPDSFIGNAGRCDSVSWSVWSIVRRKVLVELVAVETNDPVSARLLRDVQRVIGGAHEHITVADARVRPGGNTEASRAADLRPVERECMAFDFFAHPFGECHGGVQHGAGKQQHELLAAISTYAVDLTNLVPKNASELFEYRVAGLMSVRVIHALASADV